MPTETATRVSPGLNPWTRVAIAGAIALTVIAGFLFADTHGYADFVVPLRVRRLVALVLVGWAIALSTVLFQTVTGNRILTPALMGFDALYVLVQTVVVFAFSASLLNATDTRLQFVLETLLMLGFALTLFRWLFSSGRYELHVLILVGMVFATLFRSIAAFLQRLIDPSEFQVLQNLMFASFTTVDEDLVWVTAAVVAVATVLVVRRLRVYDVLALGAGPATSLGVDHRRETTRVLALVAVLVSGSTALVGPITFFGLLVAHLAYQLAGTHRHAVVLPMAGLSAVICLVGGQFVLERLLEVTTTLSVVIELVGGLTFIALLIRRARRNLA
ncbi:iron chelate uptake ABC transporter family permease subunit [Aeromicrobium senzhongii]|uniref:Iron chelate uptake ABC transporter family permease subunit n=1 Tax=Aeromicrobium senzhongii TaxID=2663859 RepID=A0ABX6SYM3_9ACTN|nr:iron chelate uptake ABC transporter family permease subunit [Aeromicrobium senzhongii]MTB87233.1 iron chelate uptake ABC transporter family permease subunit [Aeromicrobium senzhongii]QNL95697.1 iron chelate uptake ABC transporter family permease subunit [Aeromicrobium senzhongii]